MANSAINDGYKILKAMGNSKRLHILYILWQSEKSVHELEGEVGLSQSALSQHLAVLRRGALVKTRRQAQTIYYSIKHPLVRNILSMFDKFYNQNYD